MTLATSMSVKIAAATVGVDLPGTTSARQHLERPGAGPKRETRTWSSQDSASV